MLLRFLITATLVYNAAVSRHHAIRQAQRDGFAAGDVKLGEAIRTHDKAHPHILSAEAAQAPPDGCATGRIVRDRSSRVRLGDDVRRQTSCLNNDKLLRIQSGPNAVGRADMRLVVARPPLRMTATSTTNGELSIAWGSGNVFVRASCRSGNSARNCKLPARMWWNGCGIMIGHALPTRRARAAEHHERQRNGGLQTAARAELADLGPHRQPGRILCWDLCGNRSGTLCDRFDQARACQRQPSVEKTLQRLRVDLGKWISGRLISMITAWPRETATPLPPVDRRAGIRRGTNTPPLRL